jgi:hypothetical protein
MKRIALITVLAVSLPVLADEEHEHFDISPYLGGGKVQVDGLSHEGNLNPNQRVFELELGLVGGLVFAPDPGFSRDNATAIDPLGNIVNANGTGLRPTAGDAVNIRLTRDLLKWNGSGFGSVAPGVTLNLQMNYPGSTLTAGTGSTTSTGVSQIPWVGISSDVIHTHAQSFLNDSAGTPADGVYLLSMQLESTIDGVLSSDELFVVYNWNLTEADHEAAVEWVEANYVPEPASLGLLGLGSLLLRRRR